MAKVVDKGITSFAVSLEVPTKGLGPGQTKTRMIDAEALLHAAGVSNHDILGINNVELAWSGMANAGVTMVHSPQGVLAPDAREYTPHYLDTPHEVTHSRIDERGVALHSAQKYHGLASGTHMSGIKLPVRPTQERFASHKTKIEKKLTPAWDGFGPETIGAGVTKLKADVDGTPVGHYAITEHDPVTGVKSAMWNLIKVNKTNTDLFDGKYTEKQQASKKHSYDGQPAIMMAPADTKEALRTLKGSLTQYSPFHKGLGVMVTNTGSSMSNSDTTVHLVMHRTPLHPVDGIVPVDQPMPITTDHIAGWHGDKKAARAVAAGAPASKVASSGFDKYVRGKTTAEAIESTIEAIPATQDPDLEHLFADA